MTTKKKTDWLFLLGIFLMFLAVMVFHTTLTLIKNIAPPSETWGRPVKLGETITVAAPSILNRKDGTEVIWVAYNGVHKASVGLDGNVNEETVILPTYMDLNRLIGYQQAEDTFAWLEGGTLLLTTLMQETSKVHKLNDYFEYDVKDFKLVSGTKGLFLVAASKSELALFRIEGGNPQVVATRKMIGEIRKIGLSLDQKGVPIVLAGTKEGLSGFGINLFKADDAGELKPIMEEYRFEVDSMTNSGTEDLNNLEIIDLGNRYLLAYEVGISTARNLQGKVYLSEILPSGSTMKCSGFERFMPFENEGDAKVIKDFVFLRGILDSTPSAYFGVAEKNGSKMEIWEAILQDGKVISSKVSGTDGWNKLPNAVASGEAMRAVFLKVLGGQSFEVYLTGNDASYVVPRNKATLKDINVAASNNVINFIIGIMMFLFNIPYFLFLIFGLIIIQAFRTKWIDKRVTVSYSIMGILHWGIKTIVFIRMLKTNVAIEMPAFMGGAAYYVIYTGITVLAFGLVYLHSRKERDRNLLREYAIAMALDLMVSMLLIGPFVFEKL